MSARMRDSLVVTLEDGKRVLLRPVRPEDRRRFEVGLSLVSMKSRKARFLSSISSFTAQQLEYLTDVDQVDHVAWGALDAEDFDFPGYGVGRFVRCDEDPTSAEVGVVVIDDLQGRGLGRIFLALLYVIARARGFASLQATVHPTNDFMTHWLESLGGENTLLSGAYLLVLPVLEDLSEFPDNERARRFREVVERLEAELLLPEEAEE